MPVCVSVFMWVVCARVSAYVSVRAKYLNTPRMGKETRTEGRERGRREVLADKVGAGERAGKERRRERGGGGDIPLRANLRQVQRLVGHLQRAAVACRVCFFGMRAEGIPLAMKGF